MICRLIQTLSIAVLLHGCTPGGNAQHLAPNSSLILANFQKYNGQKVVTYGWLTRDSANQIVLLPTKDFTRLPPFSRNVAALSVLPIYANAGKALNACADHFVSITGHVILFSGLPFLAYTTAISCQGVNFPIQDFRQTSRWNPDLRVSIEEAYLFLYKLVFARSD